MEARFQLVAKVLTEKLLPKLFLRRYVHLSPYLSP